MKRKRPWCKRSKSQQAEETVKEKDVWKHSPRLLWGGMFQIMLISYYVSVWVVLHVLHLRPSESYQDDQYAPGFWEIAGPIVAIATGAFAVLFLISLAFTISGKSKMKRALLPARCQVCPKCFYDLSARSRNDDICPECGKIAPRRECVRLWCKLLRSKF